MIDDIIPFKKQLGGFTDKMEEYRKKFNERRNNAQIGTLVGLENIIKKRKMNAQKEQSDAK